jgi:hypothetical protein
MSNFIKKHQTILTIIGLILFCIIIILPPIIHGYVYPNMGDDTSAHVAKIEALGTSEMELSLYGAYYIIGYPLKYITELLSTNIDIVFMWFSFITFMLVGLVIFWVISKLVNKLAGWATLFIVMFCSQGLMYYFYYGQIFNIINIGIILPLLLLLSIKYITKGKNIYLIVAILLSLVFTIFHTSGIYLPFIVVTCLVAYLIYCLIKHIKLDKRAVILSGCILVGDILLALVLCKTNIINTNTIGSYIVGHNYVSSIGIPFYYYLMGIISISVQILTVIILLYRKTIWVKLSNQIKLVLFLLIGVIIPLGVVVISRISIDPWRQAIDLVIPLSLIVGIMTALVCKYARSKILTILVAMIVLVSSVINISAWMGYNSVLRQPDIQALEYINEYQTYGSNGDVAYWIYDRYTNAEYTENVPQVIIVRDKPMTPRSDETNMWYQVHGLSPDKNYILDKTFSDKEVSIDIYIRN